MKHVYAVLAILLATLIAFTGSVNAQPATPFGIEAGQSIEGLECVERELHWYIPCAVPKPHPLINEVYGIGYHPSTGVFKVVAVSETEDNDNYGTHVMVLMEKVANQIASRYGEWDRLIDDNMDVEYTRPEQWATSLYRGNRFYLYAWQDVAQYGLRSIGLIAKADSQGGTWVIVEFVFTNKDEFDSMIEQDGADAF